MSRLGDCAGGDGVSRLGPLPTNGNKLGRVSRHELCPMRHVAPTLTSGVKISRDGLSPCTITPCGIQTPPRRHGYADGSVILYGALTPRRTGPFPFPARDRKWVAQSAGNRLQPCSHDGRHWEGQAAKAERSFCRLHSLAGCSRSDPSPRLCAGSTLHKIGVCTFNVDRLMQVLGAHAKIHPHDSENRTRLDLCWCSARRHRYSRALQAPICPRTELPELPKSFRVS